jgi:hypothetical protein
MALILTATARVTDWKALQQLNQHALVDLARTVGASRYQIYRNAHDAARVLVVAELPDGEALAELATALATQLRTLAASGPADDQAWLPLDWDGIG